MPGRSKIDLKVIDARQRRQGKLKSLRHFYALHKVNTAEKHVENAVHVIQALLPACAQIEDVAVQ